MGNFRLKVGTEASWLAQTTLLRTIPIGTQANVIDEDNNVIYSVHGNGADDIFDLPRNYPTPIIESAFDNPILLDKDKNYEVQQTADIVINFDETPNASVKKTYSDAIILGDSTHNITLGDSSRLLDGDDFDNTKMNYLVWTAYNGVLTSIANKISDLPVIDSTAPTWTTASFSVEDSAPTILIMPLNEALNASIVPATTDFAVLVNASSATVSSVSLATTNQVRLTLAVAIEFGDTITVAYTQGTNKLQDNAGNFVANLTATVVTNNVLEEEIAIEYRGDQQYYEDALGTDLAENGEQIEIWGSTIDSRDFDKLANGITYNTTAKTLDNNGSGSMVLADNLDDIFSGASAKATFIWFGNVTNLSAVRTLFGVWNQTTGTEKMKFTIVLEQTTGIIVIATSSTGTTQTYVVKSTTGVTTNSKAFIAIVMDLTQASDTDRYKIYYNGTLLTNNVTVTTNRNIATGVLGQLQLNHRISTAGLQVLTMLGKNAYIKISNKVYTALELSTKRTELIAEFPNL